MHTLYTLAALYVGTTAATAITFVDAGRAKRPWLQAIIGARFLAYQAVIGAVGMGWIHLPMRAAQPVVIWFS